MSNEVNPYDFLIGDEGYTIIQFARFQPPTNITCTLQSTSNSRKIEICTTNDNVFFLAQNDYTLTDQIVVNISMPVSHVKFTGVVGDRCVVLIGK